MRDAGTSQRPAGLSQIKSPGERTMWSPRKQGRHEREVASDRTPSPPRSLQPRIRLRVKRSSPPRPSSGPSAASCADVLPLFIYFTTSRSVRSANCADEIRMIGRVVTAGRADLAAPARPRAARSRQRPRSVTGQGRSASIFPRSAPAQSRNPASRSVRSTARRFGRPDFALARGNAQFSRGGRYPGTISFEICFQDVGVEDQLAGAIRIDCRLERARD